MVFNLSSATLELLTAVKAIDNMYRLANIQYHDANPDMSRGYSATLMHQSIGRNSVMKALRHGVRLLRQVDHPAPGAVVHIQASASLPDQ